MVREASLLKKGFAFLHGLIIVFRGKYRSKCGVGSSAISKGGVNIRGKYGGK
ncbi:MAG: hypothetical protein LUB59_05660 [Candidatus Gastranaerophilales bacterium]|nr:hypothetical protein [Candidatus Gastranaerophilales bacterium]